MKLFFVYHLPVLLIPKIGDINGFTAYNYGFFIICNREAIDNVDIIKHELVHSQQTFRTFGLHVLLYSVSKKYRYKAELEAYKVSIKYGLSPEIAANSLSRKYNLNISKEQVLKDLLA